MLRADSRRGVPVLLGSSALCTAIWLLSINGGVTPGTLFWDNVHWTISAAVASWMVLQFAAAAAALVLSLHEV